MAEARTQRSDTITADDFLGRYRYVGGGGQIAALERAIDGVVDDMNLLVRGIARKRLADHNPVPSTITVSRNGDDLAVTIDGQTYAAPINGAPALVSAPGGAKLTLTHRMYGDLLVQTFRGKEGTRTHYCRLGRDRIDIDVTLSSPELPEQLRYRLSYQRSA